MSPTRSSETLVPAAKTAPASSDLVAHLALLRRVSTGELPASSVAQAIAASPGLLKATTSLSVLGLHPAAAPLVAPPGGPPPETLALIVANAAAARTTMCWGQSAAAVVATRASELWIMENQATIDRFGWIKSDTGENVASREGGSCGKPTRRDRADIHHHMSSPDSWSNADVSAFAELAGISKADLADVAAMIDIVGGLQTTRLPKMKTAGPGQGSTIQHMAMTQVADLHSESRSINPKMASYVFATSTPKDPATLPSFPAGLPLVELVRAIQSWTDALVDYPNADWAALLACIIGICVGRNAPADVRCIAWLSWIRGLRSLCACLSASQVAEDGIGDEGTPAAASLEKGGLSRTLTTLMLAPFGTAAGSSVPGEHAAAALAALSKFCSPFSDFASLRIGLDPGVQALISPEAALEFVAASSLLPEPVCQTILDFLESVVSTSEMEVSAEP